MPGSAQIPSRADNRAGNHTDDKAWPSVCVIVPARNEADMLPKTLPALLSQQYDGKYSVVIVDDHSEDSTARTAVEIAQQSGAAERLTVISSPALPEGWTGKVFAQQTGLQHAPADAEYVLFTDADILHPPNSLQTLVRQAANTRADLVSLMVRLDIQGFWASILIPAFVYFFAMLYPFQWVANPRRRTAAAAGGSILVRRKLVARDGGLAPMADALIDDCALAKLVQSRGGTLWLGLGDDVASLREAANLQSIWNMVARSAYVQLKYSFILLVGTVVGMALLYLYPVVLALVSIALLATNEPTPSETMGLIVNGLAWVLMTASFMPMLAWYRVSRWKAMWIPLSGLLYTLMTIDSARRFWLGKEDAWKGRPYRRYHSAKPL